MSSLTFYLKCSNLIQADRDKSDKPKYRALNFILHQTADDWNYYSEKFVYFYSIFCHDITEILLKVALNTINYYSVKPALVTTSI
jgi:hypothetical protein